MIKLSAVIITLNEEKNLKRCLESLSDIVDEIIIVDSFSQDRTREISESFDAKFILHEFEDYVKQKNFAVSQASFDHILALDADEYLSEDLRASIKDAKKTMAFNGYNCNRRNFFCGQWIKYSDWYPNIKLRLFDRTKASWQGHIIHEKVVMNDPNSKVGFLRGDLLHYTYQTYSEFNLQTEKFSSLSAKSYFLRGKKAPLWKIMFGPIWAFIKTYLFKLGVLDGFNGFVIAYQTANITFLKYSKLRELNKNAN